MNIPASQKDEESVSDSQFSEEINKDNRLSIHQELDIFKSQKFDNSRDCSNKQEAHARSRDVPRNSVQYTRPQDDLENGAQVGDSQAKSGFISKLYSIFCCSQKKQDDTKGNIQLIASPRLEPARLLPNRSVEREDIQEDSNSNEIQVFPSREIRPYRDQAHSIESPRIENYDTNKMLNNQKNLSEDGLDMFAISRITDILFSPDANFNKEDIEKYECIICLVPFEKGDRLKLLFCTHRYHEDCIIEWLKKKSICPNCNFNYRSINYFAM